MFHKASAFLNILVNMSSSDEGKFLQNISDKLQSL